MIKYIFYTALSATATLQQASAFSNESHVSLSAAFDYGSMPAASSEPVNGSHYRIVQKFKANWCTSEFVQYESQRTGMRVVVVNQKGPKVNGYFTLATEIHDDSGAPHTLEHLVFMGSKSYKYKGILDKLATRAYSNTNAWTAVDHTAYTLDTAGWDGFAQILPVYLEHVLLPTLTDAACYTEVHHVDGQGHDAGVVYSEMQGIQNSQGELMELAARRKIYPEQIGFRYETGGLMENLRVLTSDRIREFHKDMYQPKNLCLVLIGEVDHGDLLSILDKFEDSIQNDVPRLDEPFTRPWTKHGHTPALKQSSIDTVEFPEADETMGEILIAYIGPPYEDDLLGVAMDVFLTYVCGSSVSVLDNVLVEKEQLASGIYYTTDIRPDVTVWFSLSGVETKKLQAVSDRFFALMSESADQPIDMKYMLDCIRRFRRQLIFVAENSARTFADSIIYDHLFGRRDGSDLAKLARLDELEKLEKWSEDQWRDFWKRWFTSAHHVTTLGKPSAQLAESIESREKARIEEQQAKLGPDGLSKLAAQLDAAKAENDREIPLSILADFKIPDTSSIHFIPTITARAGTAKKLHGHDPTCRIQSMVDSDEATLPRTAPSTFIHFEHIPTNFVHLNLVLCTHAIPVELRPLLSIFVSNFLETPVRRGTEAEPLTFEAVVTQLERDTIAYEIDMGDSIGNSETVLLKFQIELDKYRTTIAWLRDLLYHPVFDVERLVSCFAKILADIPESKRSGSSMAAAIYHMMHLSEKSTSRAQNVLVKAAYLPATYAELQSNPDSIIEKLETIRGILARPENMRAFIFADLEKLPDPVSAWADLYPSSSANSSNEAAAKPLAPLDPRSSLLSPSSQPFGSHHLVVPMRTSDSSFLYLSSAGPSSYTSPQLPALSVALAYLEAIEGPLWTSVRGAGLAYGVNFGRDINLGILSFNVYRSPDAFRAYRASKEVIGRLAAGDDEIDDLGLEGAVSSIVVQFANEQPTMASAANIGFVNEVVKGVGKGYGKAFMEEVRRVTKDEVRRAMRELVMRVFDGASANLVATCSVSQEERIKKGFADEGWHIETKALEDFQEGYGVKGGVSVEDVLGADDLGEDEGSDGGSEEGSDDDDDEVDEE